MIYGSVCSGIEAATVSWHGLGWIPAWFSEIEAFPCRLLKHYYPHVPNLGDMLKIEQNETFQKTNIDLLVGGTPCQSFSTAGLRGGLADARGNLALEFCRILAIKRPRWFVWENVPGVFSVDKGKAFESILQGFQECGYSVSWRVLDAQFFGVPQRRRRVFVVGHLGDDWRPSAAVLFEPQSLRGNTAPGKSEGASVAGNLGKRTGGRSIGAEEARGEMPIVNALTKNGVGAVGPDDNQAQAGHLIAGTIDASYGRLQGCSGQDSKHGHSTLVFGGNNTSGPIDVSAAINSSKTASGRMDFESENFVVTAPTLTCYNLDSRSPQSQEQQNIITEEFRASHHVRRLTPLECERLQGFPDNYTNIPGAKDSPRYESIGNSMATVVMRWIGERIDYYDKIFQ